MSRGISVDQSFQSLVIFFFLKSAQSEVLSSAVKQLMSELSEADANESVFDMECQDISTHVTGCRSVVHVTVPSDTASERPSPVLSRRSIHQVKTTSGLQALHEYDGCDQEDEPTEPLQSSDSQIEEIVVPIGFNSQIIKYVDYSIEIFTHFQAT